MLCMSFMSGVCNLADTRNKWLAFITMRTFSCDYADQAHRWCLPVLDSHLRNNRQSSVHAYMSYMRESSCHKTSKNSTRLCRDSSPAVQRVTSLLYGICTSMYVVLTSLMLMDRIIQIRVGAAACSGVVSIAPVKPKSCSWKRNLLPTIRTTTDTP